MKDKLLNFLLFLFLAVPGAFAFVFSTILLITIILESNRSDANYFRLIVIALIGAVLMLIGLRKLQQWKYIFVFASIPFGIFIATIFTSYVSPHPALTLPLIGGFTFVIPYFIYKRIKKHYEKI